MVFAPVMRHLIEEGRSNLVQKEAYGELSREYILPLNVLFKVVRDLPEDKI